MTRSKVVTIEYRCLYCGNLDGTPTSDHTEVWFWRYLTHGTIGPFCTDECAQLIFSSTQPQDKPPQYSLDEWERLNFLRWRVDNNFIGLPIIESQE